MAFGLDDGLALAGIGVSGLSQLLQSLGIVKSPEDRAMDRQNQQRQAQLAYLQANLPEFSYQAKAYDPSKHQDVLQPAQERIQGQQQQLGNQMSLGGMARGGVSQELAMRQMARGNQQMSNLNTGLAREDEESAYDRALKEYALKAQRAQALAQLQG